MSSPRKVHVLEIVGNAVVGGMETYVTRLVERLPKDRFRITCLCPFESPFADALREHGCDVYVTPIHDDPSWISIQFTVSIVRSLRIDVIHAHLSNAYLLASVCSAMTGVKTLTTLHGRSVWPMDFEIYRLGQSRLTVVCQNAYQHALSLGVFAEDVELVPNGVDAYSFAQPKHPGLLRRELGLPRNALLVGFVGRLAPEKGPANFVRMAALVLAKRADTHFVLVGEGPLRSELETLVEASGASNRIHFAGTRADMVEVYHSLDVVVLTSESEGMPLALMMEAMAAGLPTVASHVGGVAEIVSAGMTGLLIPPGRPELAATAVLSLLNDAPRRRAMGKNAAQRVRRRFPLHKSVERIAEILVELAGIPINFYPEESEALPTVPAIKSFPAPRWISNNSIGSR